MADFPLDSHQDAKVAIDEQERQATSSLQYLLEKRDMIPITRHNTLTFKICGQEGFALIAKDLWEAKESADIICWGFDPAMELERSGDTWPRGLRYGDLLTLISTRDNPVKVRLLVWCDSNPIVYKGANNIPGYTDHSDYYSMSSPYDGKNRQDYCVEWWRQNLPGGKNLAGENKNLQVAFREVARKDVLALLAMKGPTLTEDEDDTGFQEQRGFELAGSHHQKPILIDYDYDEGSKAIGYVMGLNSVTDYWDRTAHEIDDPLRERWSSDQLEEETKHQTAAEGKPSSSVYKHVKPYQDYACRVQGPALKQLKYNFERAWAATIGQPLPYEGAMPAEPAKILKAEGNPAHLVQIVRTQAHERDKSIKELYFHASSQALNYIYIENQYFIYPQFARNLKKTRQTFCDDWKQKASGKPISEMPRLYVLIVIPHPERDDFTPRTYDMLSELGHGQTVGGINEMPGQGALMDKGKDDWKYPDSRKRTRAEGGGYVLDRPSVDSLDQTLGLDVSIARLRTSGPDANGNMAYREIYIHSKLMIIDDAFITVGSANMSQRSMSVDSEINIAATGQLYAADLRERVFELLSAGKVKYSGDPKDMPAAYDQWLDVMATNKSQRKSNKPMFGFLLQFEEHRSTTSMQASIDVPTSNDTAFG